MAAAHAHGACTHHGYHTGLGYYMHEQKHIRYVLICDDCGEEVREVQVEPYVPDPVIGPGAGFLQA